MSVDVDRIFESVCLSVCPQQGQFQGARDGYDPPVRILAPCSPNEVYEKRKIIAFVHCIYITPQIYVIYHAQKVQN